MEAIPQQHLIILHGAPGHLVCTLSKLCQTFDYCLCVSYSFDGTIMY